MARRPVFVPVLKGQQLVEEVTLEFEWFPGFAKNQARKSIAALHKVARQAGIEPVLEISSKSEDPLGVALSAFNLTVAIGDRLPISVEAAFQGSKIFERGGPYRELYSAPSWEAKKDERLRASGNIIGFNLFGEDWPPEPITAFYDWLYLTALLQNRDLAEQLLDYKGFSDIAFNPERSVNCQARTAAIFVTLSLRGDIDQALQNKQSFIDYLTRDSKTNNETQPPSIQLGLPLGD